MMARLSKPIRLRRLLQLAASIAIITSAFTFSARQAYGDVTTPPRQKLIEVEYTQYEWWLATWAENDVVCQIYIEHVGPPTHEEIFWFCGSDISKQWSETETCPQALEDQGDPTKCEGLYLNLAKVTSGVREIVIDLPIPSVWVTLEGCIPIVPENRCDFIPKLRLLGEEPLPNEYIISVHGSIDDIPFHCENALCDIPLKPTDSSGIYVYFQADSSLGDSSPVFNARIRVVEAPATQDQSAGWYIDVLSPQWRGAPIAGCSQVWDTFPPAGGPPEWLSTPEEAESLATEEPYIYLAGVLISYGDVNAQDCPNGGLLPTGGANVCGLDRALDVAKEWQNQFDEIILRVARDTSVPAQLMKNLFARESQLWPGIFSNVEEAGLGQLTEFGADTTLLWNKSFYDQFCPLVLEAAICENGYPHMIEEEQAMLRGALYSRVNAQCEECSMGIDMKKADYSVEVFAETLLANCAQVSQMIWNTTGNLPRTSTFEDLWRFTVLNYNAGPGCLADAIEDAWSDDLPLSWENVSLALSPGCAPGINYVNDISK